MPLLLSVSEILESMFHTENKTCNKKLYTVPWNCWICFFINLPDFCLQKELFLHKILCNTIRITTIHFQKALEVLYRTWLQKEYILGRFCTKCFALPVLVDTCGQPPLQAFIFLLFLDYLLLDKYASIIYFVCACSLFACFLPNVIKFPS